VVAHDTRRVLTGLLFAAKFAAVLLVVLVAAAGAGTLAMGTRFELAVRCALGLALWAQTLLLLALCGALRAMPIAVLGVVAIGGGVGRGLRLPKLHAPFIAGIALSAALFVLALFPPLAFDETLYHLPFIRALARSGALQFLPELRFPVFPQLHELLCVPALLLAGDVATHLVALAELIVTAALLVAWKPRAGVLAAALFLGSPIVLHLATIGYVDTALTLFVTAGCFCVDRFLDRGERLPLLLAGLFLGTACSVKYLGGYFAVAALAIVLVLARDRIRAALTLAGAVLAFALPTTLWLVANTGNPVFPFLPRLFGANAWSHPLLSMPLAARAARIARLAWDATFARERLNAQPPVTPLLMVMLVLVLAAALRDVRARCVAILAAGYVAAFTFLPQDTRYLVPLLPLLSMTAASAIVARRPEWSKALAWIAIAPGALYVAYRLAMQGAPPVSASARETLLARRVPEYTAVLHAGTARVYVCGGEQLKDYARGPLLGDVVGPFSNARILGSAHDTATIAARLQPLGVEMYLVAKRVCPPPRANGGMELVFEDGAAQLWRISGMTRVIPLTGETQRRSLVNRAHTTRDPVHATRALVCTRPFPVHASNFRMNASNSRTHVSISRTHVSISRLHPRIFGIASQPVRISVQNFRDRIPACPDLDPEFSGSHPSLSGSRSRIFGSRFSGAGVRSSSAGIRSSQRWHSIRQRWHSIRQR
jgi:hypothetical protein